ncbi:MAG TPA: hypothetical protein VET65_04860 [Candidatus Limnocylindrales bacterium]|nr:hypothetical protein [Candidatus Limnocylindrales bacterium]
MPAPLTGLPCCVTQLSMLAADVALEIPLFVVDRDGDVEKWEGRAGEWLAPMGGKTGDRRTMRLMVTAPSCRFRERSLRGR